MENKTVILISGTQGSGKTTLMNDISRVFKEQGTTVVPIIFADTIYKIHDFAIELLERRGVKRDIVKDGKLLQMLGTEWGRNTIGENVWIDCLKGQMKTYSQVINDSSPIVFIVSDCRFMNEFDGVPEAVKVRLEASREVRKSRCSQWRENDTHPSETNLDSYAREGIFNCYIDTELSKEESVRSFVAAMSLWNSDKTIRGLGFEEVAEKYYK